MTDKFSRVNPKRLAGADALWVVYHDFTGLARAKVVPPERFDDAVTRGVTFAKANWDFLIDDHQLPQPGYGADSGDFYALPDGAALVPVPYRPGVWQAEAVLLDQGGEPWSGDPRLRLALAVGRLAEHGVHARIAFESEFLLAVRDGDDWAPAGGGRMFTLDEVEARWEFVGQFLRALAEMGVGLHQFAKEYGAQQYEYSLLPADPVAAADRFLLARQVIKALARDRGLLASFMPKPFAELAGNGLHVHLSLVDADGRNLFAGESPEELSDLGGRAIAGLLRHAQGQAALAAPTPNSYKRLLPGSWAPAHVCWGFGNRAALVRVPGPGDARRVEYRSSDASGNPYLLLIGLLAAIRDGLEAELDPPEPVSVDVGHLDDQRAAALGASRLPNALGPALDALARDSVLLDALGPSIAEHYLALKRFELSCYEEGSGLAPAASEVSRWERITYLESL